MSTQKSEVKETHPSYGCVEVSNVCGPSVHLFGACGPSSNRISLVISTGKRVDAVDGRFTAVYPEQRVIEVEMTFLQFALLVSRAGGSVPCTIRYRDGQPVRDIDGHTTSLERIVEDFRVAMIQSGKSCDEFLQAARTLKEKDSVTKADRENFVKIAESLVATITSIQPYVAAKAADYVQLCQAEILATIDGRSNSGNNRPVSSSQ